MDQFNSVNTDSENTVNLASNVHHSSALTMIAQYDSIWKLGSPCQSTTFIAFESSNANNQAFQQFWIRLSKFLTKFLPLYNIPLPMLQQYDFFISLDDGIQILTSSIHKHIRLEAQNRLSALQPKFPWYSLIWLCTCAIRSSLFHSTPFAFYLSSKQ